MTKQAPIPEHIVANGIKTVNECGTPCWILHKGAKYYMAIKAENSKWYSEQIEVNRYQRLYPKGEA